MNDFAARLVARALGGGSSIRPRVLPLFAAAEMPDSPVGFLEENAFAPATDRQDTPRKPPAAPAPRLHEDEAEPPIETAVARQPRRRLTESPESAPVTRRAPAPVAETPGIERAATLARDMPAATEPVPFRPQPQASREADTERTPRRAEPVAVELRPPPQASGSEPPLAQVRSEPAAPVSLGSPPERIPPREDELPNRRYREDVAESRDFPPHSLPIPGPASLAAHAQRSPSAQADEPPSIVVEIGAIEFRAPPAPAQSRAAARPRPSLALADYLARRR